MHKLRHHLLTAMRFHEIQRAPRGLRIFFWVILGVTSAVGALLTFVQWQTGTLEGASGIVAMLTAVVVFPVVLVAWLNLIRQHVEINETGISVQQKGLMWKPRIIPWSTVTSATVRPMSPFAEFGGWGIRLGFSGKWGYIMDGKHGLEVVPTKGRTRVISIVDVQGARQALEAYFRTEA